MTADATQIFVRVQEDAKVARNMEEINNKREEGKEMAIFLDLKKAYARVSRPILWAILEKYRLPNKKQAKEPTRVYIMQSQGGGGHSTEFILQR